MNFWTGLILGIIIGWLVEWIIDWLFWRRDAEDAREAELLVEGRGSTTVDMDAEWESRLANAEQEYQERLRAVEEDWQSRLNLNEQQWQSQFASLEAENLDLRTRVADVSAGAVLGATAVAAYDDENLQVDAFLTEDAVLADEMAIAELAEEDIDFVMPAADEGWQADQLAIEVSETGDLGQMGELDADLAERLHLAGIDTIEDLATADPTTLAVATGIEREEAGDWIDRAAALHPDAEIVVETPASTARHDDLTRVHGIGPKYAALLAAEGITSFDDLAAASPDRLRDIIKPSVMQQINFDGWSAQAVALANTRSVMAGDDLTELEGIGPVYAAKLRERGISTFADLAAADEATLADIIAAPAWRRINYGEWIAQAKLAAEGDEIALAELQNRLFRRGGDNLNLIHGMGERSATALQAAGITSFAALAGSSPQQLDEVVRGAGVRGGFDYEAWIHEAGLRAAGKRVPSTRAHTVQLVACPQDLSAVHGIGPVYEERLYAAGIGTYWSLAQASDDELVAILGTQSFQDTDLGAIKAAAMKLAAETNSLGRAWNGSPPDDFDGLPGIGEVYERRLYEAGICTYEAMAAASPEQLAAICKAPPMRTPDYATWIATAAELSAARRIG